MGALLPGAGSASCKPLRCAHSGCAVVLAETFSVTLPRLLASCCPPTPYRSTFASARAALRMVDSPSGSGDALACIMECRVVTFAAGVATFLRWTALRGLPSPSKVLMTVDTPFWIWVISRTVLSLIRGSAANLSRQERTRMRLFSKCSRRISHAFL
ncbi:uncharacterized protein LOC143363483 [Halictus rubicundus]|uniref:uncharacterized protein LOC143363483 n=1 Tax=Halictus rubicundus TaxID=77578 RepID=UPI00403635FA